MGAWMDGRTDGWMDGRTDGCMDGWMDGCRIKNLVCATLFLTPATSRYRLRESCARDHPTLAIDSGNKELRTSISTSKQR